MGDLLTVKKQKSNRLGLTLVMWSFVFYFLPDFALIDIFPDVIAYILLYIGLGKLSFLNDSIDSARNLFFKMILISAGKLLALYLTFSNTNPKEQASFMLLMVFVFALIEGIILIPAYIRLFDGLLYLGTRYDGKAVFGKQKTEFSKSASDKIKFKTIAFIILKNLFLVIPETASLSVKSFDDYSAYNMGMYQFIPHLRISGMILSLIFGIIWFVSVISYFRSIKKDKPFIDRLKDIFYSEVLPKENLFIERSIKISGIVLCIASVLAVDFYLNGNDGYNLIPDALFAIGVFAGLFMIRKYIPKPLLISNGVFALAYSALSFFNTSMIADFMAKYNPKKIWRNSQAFNSWIQIIVFTVIEMLLFLGVVVTLLLALKKMIDNHTGYAVERENIDVKSKLRSLHLQLYIPLIITLAFALFAAVGGVTRVVLFSKLDDLSNSSWLIELALTVIFSGTMIYSVSNVQREVRDKYKYE